MGEKKKRVKVVYVYRQYCPRKGTVHNVLDNYRYYNDNIKPLSGPAARLAAADRLRRDG